MDDRDHKIAAATRKAIEAAWNSLGDLESVLSDDTYGRLRLALEWTRDELAGTPEYEGKREQMATMEARRVCLDVMRFDPPPEKTGYDGQKNPYGDWAKKYHQYMTRVHRFTPNQAWQAWHYWKDRELPEW